MIYYDCMDEAWRSTEDPAFDVDFTPESSEDCDNEFETEDDFWDWYNGNTYNK